MSAHVQMADQLGQAMPPQNGADFMKAITSILTPQQLELVRYLMMHPDQYAQVRQQFFAGAQGTAGLAAAAGGSNAPAQPMAAPAAPAGAAPAPDEAEPAAPAAPATPAAAPVAVHVHIPKAPAGKRA